MGIFKKFTDTIFLKETSDLEKQLNELKQLRDKVLDKDKIDKDIRLLEYGIRGEKDIAFELKNANLGMYVLHDVTFECDGNKAQIDYLIFTKGYNYLVECKNLFGNITIDDTGQFRREYTINNRIIKESIYSPFTQAVRHQEIMKKVWSSNHSKIDNILYKNMLDKNWFKPIVVLANSKGILHKRYAPKDIKDNTIRADQLVEYIKNDLYDFDRFDSTSESIMKNSAETWLARSIDNTKNSINKYKNISNEKLINELKTFRKEKSKSMNVPPYYIFNDEELNAIISNKPNNVEKLKELNILPTIKVKCHGDEIINILNNYN